MLTVAMVRHSGGGGGGHGGMIMITIQVTIMETIMVMVALTWPHLDKGIHRGIGPSLIALWWLWPAAPFGSAAL